MSDLWCKRNNDRSKDEHTTLAISSPCTCRIEFHLRPQDYIIFIQWFTGTVQQAAMEGKAIVGSCLLMVMVLSCIPCTTGYCFNSYGSCITWAQGGARANWIGCLACCRCRGYKDGHCARTKRAGVCPRQESYTCQCFGSTTLPIPDMCDEYPAMLLKCA